MTTVNPNQPIHPKFDERISVKVGGQLPAFVKQDHETFVAFMEAYYEYMEQQGKPYEIIGNLDNYANLDKTTDEFLDYFKNQFAQDIPEAVFANANKPFVLKHLRDFYRAKGSEKSFQFLFRLLYKEEISFYFPGKDLLRTSDGRFGKSEIIRTVDNSGSDSIFNFVGKKIKGETSGAIACVENVINEIINNVAVSTIFLSGVIGTFIAGEKIFIGTVESITVTDGGSGYVNPPDVFIDGGGGEATRVTAVITNGAVTAINIDNKGFGYTSVPNVSIAPENRKTIQTRKTATATATLTTLDDTNSFTLGGMITDYSISSSGNNYKVGDIVRLSGFNQKGTLIKIADLTVGWITDYTINDGGINYEVGDKLTINNTNSMDIDARTASILVKEVDSSGTITKLEIENGGRGYTSLPTISGGGSGSGLDITLIGDNIGGVKTLKIENNGFSVTEDIDLDFSNLDGSGAAGKALLGGYEDSFQSGFTGTNGFLNSDKYIQDSFYYQLFSYVITSGQTIDKWRDIVKRVVHPAGLALFGNYQIISNIDLGETFRLTNVLDTKDRYTIIFHDPDQDTILDARDKIAKTLRVPIESCNEFQNILVFADDQDYNRNFENEGPLKFESDAEAEANIEDYQTSSLTEAVTETEDFGLTTQSTFHQAPTKCQTYEQDLGIQKLSTLGGFDDYLFARRFFREDGSIEEFEASRLEEYQVSPTGLNSESITETEDFGWVFEDPNGVTQLRLGPLRRTIDRQKFNKQGGFSQIIDTVKGLQDITVTNQGSGYVAVPNVTISASPTGGTQATATAVLGTGADSDKVVSITINNIGSGYGAPPGYSNFVSVTIDPPASGVQAEATAVFLRASGTKIEQFKDEQIFEYNLFAGLKTKRVMNSTFKQFATATGLRVYGLPFGGTGGAVSKGYYTGGANLQTNSIFDNIQRFSVVTDGNGATTVGNLSSSKYLGAGLSSAIDGYYAAGNSGQLPTLLFSSIEKFNFVSEGNSTAVSNITQEIDCPIGIKSELNGYVCGGLTSDTLAVDTIDKFNFVTEAEATTVGSLSNTRSQIGGSASSSIDGYVIGGVFDNVDGPTVNIIEKFSYSNESSIIDVGDLSVEKARGSGNSSQSDGYYGGGRPDVTQNPVLQVVEKFSFSTNNVTNNVTNLTAAREDLGGVSSTTAGYNIGGNIINFVATVVVDKFLFSSESPSVGVGDLDTETMGGSTQQI